MFKKIPHTYVIIFSIIVLSAIMTWFIPGGEYSRHRVSVNGVERTVIEKGSFHFVENQPQTWQVFTAFFKGFERQAGIIAFILMIGGAFWIVNSSKAIDIGILSFLKYTQKLEKNRLLKKIGVNNIVITLVMLLFSVFGAVFGMSEETIAFIIIVVPLAISMGYDSIVGVSMVFVAAGLGFAGAVLNPFTIGIAQGIADLPLFSGFGYRIFSWVVINTVGISWVLWYAARIHKNPKRSVVYQDDAYWRKHVKVNQQNIDFHTPKSAWVIFFITAAALGMFAWFYPETTMKIGNAQKTLPMVPVASGLFFIS